MTSQSPSWTSRRLRFALIMLVTGAMMGVVIALRVTIGAPDTPMIGGQYNVATAFLYVLPIVSGLTAAIGYRWLLSEDTRLSPKERLAAERRGKQLGGRVFAALAVAGLVFVVTALIFYLLTDFFTGIVIPRPITVIAAGLGGAIAGFAVAWWIVAVRTGHLMIVGIAFMVGGLLLGMANVYNPLWWQNALSHMSHDSGASMFFRLGLIIGGLVVAAVAEDVAALYRIAAEDGQISRRNYLFLRAGLLAAAFGIVGVGLFPTVVSDLSDFLHNVFASVMIGAVVLGMFMIPIMVPVLPRTFRIISLVCGAGAIGLFALWLGAGMLFVFFQISILTLSGVWALIFLRYTLNFVRSEPEPVQAKA